MSVATITKSGTTSKKILRPKQQFIRLNLDESLEKMLSEYETEYSLLSRSDIIRMLLSRIYSLKKQQTRKNLVNFLNSLPKPEVEMTEDEIFKFLEATELDK